MVEAGADGAKTVRLAERRIFSPSFKPLYNEGIFNHSGGTYSGTTTWSCCLSAFALAVCRMGSS